MSQRQSNFELLRIVAMLLVVLLHANYFALGNISPTEVAMSPCRAAVRIFCEQACIVSVNVFVMISGWFGIKASLKGLCSFLFQVLFLIGLIYFAGFIWGIPFDKQSMGKAFYFGSYYWFVVAYLILFVLSPVLNAFIEHASYRSALTTIVAFFVMELLFGRINDVGLFDHGYSAIAFVGIYLLAGFLRQHAVWVVRFRARTCFFIYFIMTLIPASLSLFVEGCLGNEYMPIYYDSPAVILAAMFLMLGFARLSFSSKAVNWFASSVFAIYIIHLHPVIVDYYTRWVGWLYSSLSLPIFMIAIVTIAVLISLICILVDKVRLLCWNLVCQGKVAGFLEKY